MYTRFSSGKNGFTLIELLVVIAIIAILAVVVVLVLNPAQLLAQSRDANRVADMATLSSALSLYQTDQSGASYVLGTSSTVYTSIASASSTCGDLGLPSLPSGYVWGCAPSARYRSVNNTGWIPVAFSSISAGAPFGSLPVDPTNSVSSKLYYTYATNGSQYEVTAAVESSKYQKGGSGDVITGNGTAYSTIYAKGTSLALEPIDYGPVSGADPTLMGYWTLNEGVGTTAIDKSGNNNNGTWSGTTPYYTTGYGQTYAGSFNGSDDMVTLSSLPVTGGSDFTFTAWIDSTRTGSRQGIITLGNAAANEGVYLFINSGNKLELDLSYTAGPTSAATVTGGWHFAAVTNTSGKMQLYVDGTADGSMNMSPNLVSGTQAIGNDSVNNRFAGAMDDVRVYNRALSSGEIQTLFNGKE